MAGSRVGAKSVIQFQKEIRGGRIYEVLLLHGEEEYTLKAALRDYVARTISPDARSFDFSELRAGEVDGKSLWNTLTTLPFVAPRRCVVLDLSGEPKADTVSALKAYLKRPAPTTSLVLVAVAEGQRADLPVDLPDSVVTVTFSRLKPDDRRQWVEDYVRTQSKTIGEDALSYLITTSSPSLTDLAAKLEQACLFLGEAREISVQTLMEVSGVTSEFTVFQLEDAIMSQQPALAHRIARSLLDGGEEVLRLLAFHRSSILKLWQVLSLQKTHGASRAEGNYESELKSVLKGQYFKSEQYVRAAAKIGGARLRSAVIGLVELEVRAKSATQSPAGYYEWLWRLASASVPAKEPKLISVS